MIKLTDNVFEILLILLRNRPLNLNDIARQTMLSVMGVSKIVKKLEKEKLVTITKIGKSHIVKINVIRDNIEIFSLSEKYKFEKFIKHHPELKGFLLMFKENIKAHFCLIFGSYASGEESTSSDLDLLIVSNVDDTKMINKLKALLNINLEPMFVKKKDFINELRKKHRLYLEIMNGKRILINGEYNFWETVYEIF